MKHQQTRLLVKDCFPKKSPQNRAAATPARRTQAACQGSFRRLGQPEEGAEARCCRFGEGRQHLFKPEASVSPVTLPVLRCCLQFPYSSVVLAYVENVIGKRGKLTDENK